MFRFIMALFLGLCATGAAAQSCSEIKFARGASSGEVSGHVTDGHPLCFIFGSGAGQAAQLRLFSTGNACFTVAGVVDCQDDFSFRTQSQNYKVTVFQLFPSTTSEQFTLQLTIR